MPIPRTRSTSAARELPGWHTDYHTGKPIRKSMFESWYGYGYIFYKAKEPFLFYTFEIK